MVPPPLRFSTGYGTNSNTSHPQHKQTFSTEWKPSPRQRETTSHRTRAAMSGGSGRRWRCRSCSGCRSSSRSRRRGRCSGFSGGLLFPLRASRPAISIPFRFFRLLHLPALDDVLDRRFVFPLACQRPSKPEPVLSQDRTNCVGRSRSFLEPVLEPLFFDRDDDRIQIGIVLPQRFDIAAIPRCPDIGRNEPVNRISLFSFSTQSNSYQRIAPCLSLD